VLVLVLSASGCRALPAFALLGAAGPLCLAVAPSLLTPRPRPRPPAPRPAVGLALPPARDCAGTAVAACEQTCDVSLAAVLVRLTHGLIDGQSRNGSRLARQGLLEQTERQHWRDQQQMHGGSHRG